MQTWIERIRRTTKARDETDLPWMKKMKGERVDGREEELNMLIQRVRPATSYTPLDGYTFRAAPPKLPDQVRHHSEKSTDFLGCGAPREKWKIGGNKRAKRAHNLPPFPARMSARSRANKFETYPVG